MPQPSPYHTCLSPQILELYSHVTVSTSSSPSPAPGKQSPGTSLHVDPLRPDRIFCAHPAEGLYSLQLPPVFSHPLRSLEASDRCRLTPPTSVALMVNTTGDPTSVLGLAVAHKQPRQTLPSANKLYLLAPHPVRDRGYRVDLQVRALPRVALPLQDGRGTGLGTGICLKRGALWAMPQQLRSGHGGLGERL